MQLSPPPNALDAKLQQSLEKRRQVGTLRSLQVQRLDCLDFFSNDYLGFAKSKPLQALVDKRKQQMGPQLLGSTGSRLISGNSRYFMQVEKELAAFYNRCVASAQFARTFMEQYGDSEYWTDRLSSMFAYFVCVCVFSSSSFVAGDDLRLSNMLTGARRLCCSEAALLFNSGYSANLGVLSSLPQVDDVILYDELIHNSCHEGMRLSRAYAKGNAHSFKHNDVADLAAALEKVAVESKKASSSNTDAVARNRCVYVVVESLYSMDGDVAPLMEMTELCENAGAFLIVDEAHGTGVYGPHGSGVVRALGLDVKTNVISCRVYTFGKAMGCHGAVVCGSQVLIDYLVNYARSFIYTTAFPFEQLVTVQCVHEFCATADSQRCHVLELVQYFKRKVRANPSIPSAALLESDSPIQGVVFAGNHEVLHAAKEMIAMGIRVIPIRSPTVPKGSERFRIVIHADNTEHEIDVLVAALEAMFRARGSSSSNSKNTSKL